MISGLNNSLFSRFSRLSMSLVLGVKIYVKYLAMMDSDNLVNSDFKSLIQNISSTKQAFYFDNYIYGLPQTGR